MLAMKDRGLCTDEYLYILPDFVEDEQHNDVFVDYSSNPDGRDEEAKKAFESALMVCATNTSYSVLQISLHCGK